MYVRVLTATVLATAAGQAHAQSLDAALQDTLTSDPQVAGADALVQAAQAGVDINRSARLPTIALDASAELRTNDTLYGARRAQALNLGLSFDLPLYTGGEVTWRIRSARAALEAEKARRDALVNTRLSTAADRYASIYRDERIEAARQSQVAGVETLLTATRARQRAGDATKTDTLQAVARLAGSRARLAEARAVLTRSNEDLREVTGRYFDTVEDPEPPAVSEQVVTELPERLASFPAIRFADARIAMAQADVRVARSARAPRLYLSSTTQTGNDFAQGAANPSGFRTGMRVGFNLRIPIFQGGAPAARVRQAQQVLANRLEDRRVAEWQAVAQIRAQYARLKALDAALPSLTRALEANRAALLGVRTEIKVGTRSNLDALNAQEEVTQVEVQLAQLRQQRLSLAYAILGTMGRLASDKAPAARPVIAIAAPVPPVPLATRPIRPAATASPAVKFDTIGLWVWKGSETWSLKPGNRTSQTA